MMAGRRERLTSMNATNLPSFKKPPVIETVLGVQFERIRGLHNAHLGAFWKILGDEWSEVNDAPPIEPVFERFGEESWERANARFRLIQDPTHRIQIRNAARDRMIQVQSTRFHYNWLGQGGGSYPRYSHMKPEFAKHVETFRAFVTDENLGNIIPNQWEVTYVNHLPRGTVWNSPSDWGPVFNGLPGSWQSPTCVDLESIGGEWHFQIPDRRGRLHAQITHMQRPDEAGSEMLRFTLTARGPISRDSEDAFAELERGLDLGREVIVTAFYEMTSEDAHAYWELET